MAQCDSGDLVGGGVGGFVEFGGELDIGQQQVGAEFKRDDARGVRDVDEDR